MSSIIREALAHGERYLQGLDRSPVHGATTSEAIRDRLRGSYRFEEPMETGELVADVAEMLESWAVHTVHPRYFGYFNPTPLQEAVAGDLLAAIYNPQLAVWSHAPAAIEIEQHVLRWVTGKLGLPLGTTGAHFTSGGSEANLTAVIAALTRQLPTYDRQGLGGGAAQPTIYYSAGAHDSFAKICHMTGLGRDAGRPIPTDDSLRMDVGALRDRIQSDRAGGYAPVLIAATAGTTAAGVIDPLPAIGSTCRQEGIWFHVDAAWGGAAMLSSRLREHLRGIERADSVTCDAHKWFNVTMGAGMFFCRDGFVLERAFRVATDSMPDTDRGSVDPFVTSAQWSRRFIGLKLFLALARLGERGYAEMIETQAEMGEYMRERLAAAGWVHVSKTPLPVCCVTHPTLEAREGALARVLEIVLERGRVWISRVSLEGRQALRACVTGQRRTATQRS